MKILTTIGNKRLSEKPRNDEEKGRYFADLKFTTKYLTMETFIDEIKNGSTLTYLFKDTTFDYSSYSKVNQYMGTQYIIVDVDGQKDLDWIKNLSIQPTIWHTSFSNLTPQKGYLYCVHLIYILDSILIGEENFYRAFDKLTEEYRERVDLNARNCNRVVFTSNESLGNSCYVCNECIIPIESIISDGDRIDKPIGETNKTTVKKENCLEFKLDETFFKDLNTMKRSEFIAEYSSMFFPRRDSYVEFCGKPYADLRGVEFYEVDNKYYWDKERNSSIEIEIMDGRRTKQLYNDATQFCMCNPNITREELVYALISEVYRFYYNKDLHMTNNKIIGICKEVFTQKEKGTLRGIPTKRTFKVNRGYFAVHEKELTKQQRTAYARKAMSDDIIGNVIDMSSSIEDNMKEFKRLGYKFTKKRIMEFCDRYGISLISDKDIRNKFIINLHKAFPNYSNRDLEKHCKENGINISYKTIERTINNWDKK